MTETQQPKDWPDVAAEKIVDKYHIKPIGVYYLCCPQCQSNVYYSDSRDKWICVNNTKSGGCSWETPLSDHIAAIIRKAYSEWIVRPAEPTQALADHTETAQRHGGDEKPTQGFTMDWKLAAELHNEIEAQRNRPSDPDVEKVVEGLYRLVLKSACEEDWRFNEEDTKQNVRKAIAQLVERIHKNDYALADTTVHANTLNDKIKDLQRANDALRRENQDFRRAAIRAYQTLMNSKGVFSCPWCLQCLDAEDHLDNCYYHRLQVVNSLPEKGGDDGK